MQRNRKLKGDLPISQVLILVIAVVIAMALYFISMAMTTSTATPELQIDPYQTHSFGSFVVFAVKTGVDITYQGSALWNSNGGWVGPCTAYWDYGQALAQTNAIWPGTTIPKGTEFFVRCNYAVSTGTWYLEIVYYSSGKWTTTMLQWVNTG